MEVFFRVLKSVLFIIVCVLVNLGLGMLATNLSLPVWLDSVGTIASAIVLGPWVGAGVGAWDSRSENYIPKKKETHIIF